MLAVERAGYIMDLLMKNQFALVADLSKELNVSEETIRKDLEKLEKKGKLNRVHGGAYLNEGYGNETPVAVRSNLYKNIKAELAEKCMGLIKEKETVFLDCSTTVSYLAEELSSYEKKLTVVTNSMLAASKLMANTNIRLILLGGELNRDTESFEGYTVFEALERYHIDKAFISSAAIDGDSGMTDYTQSEADVRRKVLQEATECIFVADSTKTGKKSTYIIGDTDKITTFVTEGSIKDNVLLEKLNENNVKIIACEVKEFD